MNPSANRIQQCHPKRRALSIGRVSVCPAMGAAYAAQGIHGCMVLSHGSSGCARIMKNSFFTAYGEQIKIATNHLKENDVIFGGKEKFLCGIKNVFRYYSPDAVAVISTCMTETIGDYMPDFLLDAELPAGKPVFYIPTSGYSYSHVQGYSDFLTGLLRAFPAADIPQVSRAAILPGLMSPGDALELKRMLKQFAYDCFLLPDYAEVFTYGIPLQASAFSEYGTPLSETGQAARCGTVLGVGPTASKAAVTLLAKTVSHADVTEIPMGLTFTDRLLETYARLTGAPMPPALAEERTLLLRMVRRTYGMYYGKTAAVFADPDYAIPLAEFLSFLGIRPLLVFSTIPSAGFEEAVRTALQPYDFSPLVADDMDLYAIEESGLKPDILVGDSHLEAFGRERGIPALSAGFPDFSNKVALFLPLCGYRGAMRLIENLTHALSSDNSAFKR